MSSLMEWLQTEEASEYKPMVGDTIEVWDPRARSVRHPNYCLGKYRVTGFTDDVLVAERRVGGSSLVDQVTINFKRFPQCVKWVP